MKIKLLFLSICITNLYFAQPAFLNERHTYYQSQLNYLESIWVKGVGEINLKDIKGSPYESTVFTETIIAENYNPIKARYNNYKDEVEFERDGKIYILPKEPTFSTIKFILENKKLVLLKDPVSLSDGYFFEITSGPSISIYKKVFVEFKQAKKSESSYKSDRSATFTKPKTEYYFKSDGNLTNLPKNAKNIASFFPSKKNLIENYLKKNKLDMGKETDIKILADLINKD